MDWFGEVFAVERLLWMSMKKKEIESKVKALCIEAMAAKDVVSSCLYC